jgi:serine/threonine-protein kinase ATR
VLGSIESIDTARDQRLSTATIYFPGSPHDLSLALGDSNLPNSTFSRINLGHPGVAVKTCLQLLDVVACPLPLGSLNSRPPYLREVFCWSLQNLQRLWWTTFEWFESSESSREEKELVNLFADIIATLRKWFSYSLRLGISFDEKTTNAWLRCGRDMLDSGKLRMNLEMQHVLGQLLDEAILASHSSPSIGRLLEEQFVPRLTDLQREGHSMSALHQSFQVIFHLIVNCCLIFVG